METDPFPAILCRILNILLLQVMYLKSFDCINCVQSYSLRS